MFCVNYKLRLPVFKINSKYRSFLCNLPIPISTMKRGYFQTKKIPFNFKRGYKFTTEFLGTQSALMVYFLLIQILIQTFQIKKPFTAQFNRRDICFPTLQKPVKTAFVHS